MGYSKKERFLGASSASFEVAPLNTRAFTSIETRMEKDF
jgi:hypothetical protein